MQAKRFTFLFVLVLLPASISFAAEPDLAEPFFGRDVHIAGEDFAVMGRRSEEQVLIARGGFSMTFGHFRFSSDQAVVQLQSRRLVVRGRVSVDYKARVYFRGAAEIEDTRKKWRAKKVSVSALRQAGIGSMVFEQADVTVLSFEVSGQVLITAEEMTSEDVSGLELYKEAAEAFKEIPQRRKYIVQQGAIVPRAAAVVKKEVLIPKEAAKKETETEDEKERREQKQKIVESAAQPVKQQVVEQEARAQSEAEFMYPVNISAAGATEPVIETSKLADGSSIATVTGRFYLWQRQDEAGRLLELQADSAVVYYRSGEEAQQLSGVGGGGVTAVYMSGDVVMTEGQRVIRADELYYDFERKKALAINAEMSSFDAGRGIPIYVRASKIMQLAENRFGAEDVTLTSSEFYRPQLSLTASRVYITDTTVIDEQAGEVSDSSYDAEIYDARMKFNDMTIFAWPYLRSNLQRPDVPVKSIRIGHDSTWGTSIETRWHLARILGLQQPSGTDSTLAIDYFGKRGLGAGAEIDYSRENYFGRMLGYVISDSGEDNLGRDESRRNLKPPDKLRGRFSFLHRQFLPYNWQLTTGIGYVSDENFIESYYRGEYNVGTEETYAHMRRLEENWGVSLLTKGRINDFADEFEELPSGEFHLTGQSLFDDRFTLYSDMQIIRARQRIGDNHGIAMDEDFFSFVSHRTEVDMPVKADGFNFVPFAASTFGYDDRSGFTRTLVDGSGTGRFGQDQVIIGELGLRASPKSMWKIYPEVKSRLWDLDGMRHIISPSAVAVAYKESDSVIKQRDTVMASLSQRLETKRGPEGQKRTVDWMRLDLDVVWVKDSVSATDAGPGPDRFIWAKPLVPLRVFSAPQIYGGDLVNSLHRYEMYGPRRNYFMADYVWNISDTAAMMSDMNFDIQSGVVQQFNVGFTRLRWPNLSYYIGSRYLRRINILEEKGSNTVNFAATYKIDPRYTAVFSQQFDFDYGSNIRSDITLIRKYHRLFFAMTFSADASLKSQSIVFSIWPEGVKEFAIGRRGYMGLGGASGY